MDRYVIITQTFDALNQLTKLHEKLFSLKLIFIKIFSDYDPVTGNGFVLSAGHCTTNPTLAVDISHGTYDQLESGKATANWVCNHANYKPGIIAHDIGLIRVENQIFDTSGSE